MGTRIASWIPVAALGLIFLTSCARLQQYRTEDGPAPYVPQARSHAIIEQGPNYSVGYVEMDDQGWLYQRHQIDTVTNWIGSKLDGTNHLLLVTFIHGWKHNASGGDSNVAMFHTVLHNISGMEEFLAHKAGRQPRQVVGVYVGWRGLSLQYDPWKEFTFWDRKNSAEQVGHGGLIELLSELEKIRDRDNAALLPSPDGRPVYRTRMVTVGHSFGADVLYAAVSPALIERMVKNTDATGAAGPPKSLGDLVILINPAFEASRFQTLHELGESKAFPLGKDCTLAVFSSSNDVPNRCFFPIGRHLSELFDKYHTPAERRANLTALGFYEPFITHSLLLTNLNARALEAAASTNENVNLQTQRAAAERVAELKTHPPPGDDGTYGFLHTLLTRRPGCSARDPVFVVAVDQRIIASHDAIDSWVFVRFLTEFVSLFSQGG
ncbi:MAG TPA: hypothetical protein VHB20_05650 [Verrucomicrobiae bacterium]|jgi:hypothetical protein|nr:hypothetical protein [Verrucomicrobiae bacterium]